MSRPSSHRPDRRALLGGLVGAAGVAALTGCTDDGAAQVTPAPSTPLSPTPSAEPSGPSAADVAAVGELYRSRVGALMAGDDGAFAGSTSGAEPEAQDRQLAAFTAARALGLSRLAVHDVRLGRDPSALVGEPSLLATVALRYRVAGTDAGDRAAEVTARVVRTADRWVVASEAPSGAGATAPWLALPGLAVRRTDRAVVAGTAAVERLAEYAGIVDRALPDLARHWDRTPSRVLVLAPETTEEADVLLGRDGGAAAEVGATTEGPTDARGRATGDRVTLDPTAFAHLTPAGRDVVLTHELVHVAVRATVPGRTAAWLAEGYADHVGYRRADVPLRTLLDPLVNEIRAGRGPTDLPRLDTLAPSSGSIEVPYLAAWQAVELLVAEHGEAAVRRLVVAGSATGTDADAEAATDRALATVLGTSRAALVRAWRSRLTDLART